ncbi:hypothetical protein BYT27DRAFT_6840668 [Phlegmacium glaucopus]|nr:hypothetical protein BYT27DRAFT_6840668 [Phlegmacium glaucopus]
MSPSYHLSRDDLRDIALSTLQALDEGEYFPPGAVDPYDLTMKIQWTDDNTRYYGPDAGEGGDILESEFIRINEEGGNEGKDEKGEEGDKMSAGEQDKNASSLDGTKHGSNGSDNIATAALEAENKQIDDNSNSKAQAQVEAPIPPNPTRDATIWLGEYSTLVGARKIHLALASSPDSSPNKKIGILNFASAKKPGGEFINGSQDQEESIALTSTLFPSFITPAALSFYTHYRADPSNAYYTHAMVYSPGVVLIRDDNGEWRSPVKVDVLTSAAVNAGEIRRGLEKEERLRREREELEIWRRRGEERRRQREKAIIEKEKIMAEKERLRKEKEISKREQEKLKEKAEAGKLKKEKAGSTKLWKGTAKSGDGNGTKETEKVKETYSGSEKEETSSEDQKERDREIEKEKEEENEKAENENEEENEENENDGEIKTAEENTESKGASIQDVQPQSETTPEVSKEPTSSTTILHPLSQTQPSQAPKPDPEISYIRRLYNAESQIQHTMYTRISRILHLFQLHQTPYLILGSFGTDVFQNNTDLVATIFAELLVKPSGRFKNVFKTVVFAILGKETVRVFGNVFMRVEKRAKRMRGETGGSCVLLDGDVSDMDVREGAAERMMRMMRWQARRTALAEAAQAENRRR